MPRCLHEGWRRRGCRRHGARCGSGHLRSRGVQQPRQSGSTSVHVEVLEVQILLVKLRPKLPVPGLEFRAPAFSTLQRPAVPLDVELDVTEVAPGRGQQTLHMPALLLALHDAHLSLADKRHELADAPVALGDGIEQQRRCAAPGHDILLTPGQHTRTGGCGADLRLRWRHRQHRRGLRFRLMQRPDQLLQGPIARRGEECLASFFAKCRQIHRRGRFFAARLCALLSFDCAEFCKCHIEGAAVEGLLHRGGCFRAEVVRARRCGGILHLRHRLPCLPSTLSGLKLCGSRIFLRFHLRHCMPCLTSSLRSLKLRGSNTLVLALRHQLLPDCVNCALQGAVLQGRQHGDARPLTQQGQVGLLQTAVHLVARATLSAHFVHHLLECAILACGRQHFKRFEAYMVDVRQRRLIAHLCVDQLCDDVLGLPGRNARLATCVQCPDAGAGAGWRARARPQPTRSLFGSIGWSADLVSLTGVRKRLELRHNGGEDAVEEYRGCCLRRIPNGIVRHLSNEALGKKVVDGMTSLQAHLHLYQA
mmetsp:Transcript_15844/g.45755  ORF Transcript_15844/g.45755 Transcript_15844/m.45755 type:complete len:534 (+) Transcript_15844:248-1849(+)